MTPRELEIFLMLAKGTPTRAIADQLNISSKTVSNHLTLLKSKLQVSSHAELVHLGIDLGVVGGWIIGCAQNPLWEGRCDDSTCSR